MGKSILEFIVEAANDVGVPKTNPEMLNWILRFILRWWDERVLRQWQEDRRVLLANWKGSGHPYIAQTGEYHYQLCTKLGRNVHSIRRSLDRLRKMRKIS